MHKIRAIALREYLAAVKAKAFVVTILLMPVLMGSSIGIQVLFQKLDAEKEKRLAFIDRTPGMQIAKDLEREMKHLDDAAALDPEKAKMLGPKFNLEVIEPSEPTPATMAKQRFDVSQRIESGELAGLVEIGPDVFAVVPPLTDPRSVDDTIAVRLQLKNPMHRQFLRRAELLINQSVVRKRLDDKKLPVGSIATLMQPVVIKQKSLTRLDPKTGEWVDAADETRIVNLILPGVLIGLMFMIIMIGATPAMHGIIEEKSQRIAEVLLGSATPFQIMTGKLLGIIGVALTMSVVYLGGGYFLVNYYGYADLVPLRVLAWYLPMMVLALLIFGSLFIAVGAAAADIKDTQTLLMPIMIFACLPMFAIVPIMQDPNGPIARICSFFPFATPMLLVAREAVPPGVPLWEMLAGVMAVLVTTWLCVWAASRIFRVGILMHGKGPKFGDLIRWAIKG